MNARIDGTSFPIGPWVWLFPFAYGLHVAEEYVFQFPVYIATLSGRLLSNSQFLLLNAVFWFLMVAIVILVRARPAFTWLVITLAAVLGINAALHLLGTVLTLTYSPGTVTAALLYGPLVLYAVRRILPLVGRRAAMRALALGAAIHAGVLLLAANPSWIPAP